MWPTRYYLPLGLLLLLLILVLQAFADAVSAGQIAVPAAFVWLVKPLQAWWLVVLLILRQEDAKLLGPVAQQIAQAGATGAVAGVKAAGGLPASELAPRDDSIGASVKGPLKSG